MPSIELGPHDVTFGEGDKTRSVKLLRIASFVNTHVELDPELLTKGAVVTHVARLLKLHEDRLTSLLMSLREGSVGFEETDGVLTKLILSYPEIGESEGKIS